jgi:hypothetical protein
MAPPIKYHLNPNQIADYAAMGCSAEEIAIMVTPEEEANLGHSIDHTTLERRYTPALKAGRGRMKGKLRSQLFAQAMNGNTAILIFLAKTVLGMREKSPLEDMMLPEGVTGDMPGVTVDKPYTERGIVFWLREVMPSIEKVTREVETDVQQLEDLPEIRMLSPEELETLP